MHSGSFPGAVYAVSPLMHEDACLVRKLGGFRVADCCKWLLDMGLKNFAGSGFGRIVQTGSVRLSVKGRKGKDKSKLFKRRPRNSTYIGTRYL